MTESEYISSSEAAEMLDVTPRSITKWVKRGYLVGYKVGPGKTSGYRILKSSVEDKIPPREEPTK